MLCNTVVVHFPWKKKELRARIKELERELAQVVYERNQLLTKLDAVQRAVLTTMERGDG